MDEKRKFQRKTVDLQASVILDGGAGPVAAVVRDMSIGGVYVVCGAPVTFGQKVTLEVTVGAAGLLRFAGLVRWKGDDGFGIQFGLLGARETHAIAQQLKK